jgi:hypothetical protein
LRTTTSRTNVLNGNYDHEGSRRGDTDERVALAQKVDQVYRIGILEAIPAAMLAQPACPGRVESRLPSAAAIGPTPVLRAARANLRERTLQPVNEFVGAEEDCKC